MKNLKIIAVLISLFIFMNNCKKEESNTPSTTTTYASDANFKIVSNTNSNFKSFSKKVEVFGISIYAVAKVEDNKLLHAANIMAQYLDNNEDGTVDNQPVLDAMKKANAYVVMWKTENDLNMEPPANAEGQDLGNDETNPTWHTNGQTGRFDAALEEILHIITHTGYANVYPEIFGEKAGTSISNAMDIARGGQFTSIPNSYPENAWYSYDDATCLYNCQVTEYTYWAFTSILGAQKNRLSEINNEWKLNTKELVETKDTKVYKLLTDPQYKFPTKLPDGTYKH